MGTGLVVGGFIRRLSSHTNKLVSRVVDFKAIWIFTNLTNQKLPFACHQCIKIKLVLEELV